MHLPDQATTTKTTTIIITFTSKRKTDNTFGCEVKKKKKSPSERDNVLKQLNTCAIGPILRAQ